MAISRTQDRLLPKLDIISLVLSMGAVLFFGYTITEIADFNAVLAIKSQFLIILAMPALVIALVLIIIKKDPFAMKDSDFVSIIFGVSAAVGFLLIIQGMVKLGWQMLGRMAALPAWHADIFYMMAGIAEESFFRMLIFNLLFFAAGGSLAGFALSSLFTSGAFTIWHFRVYGAEKLYMGFIPAMTPPLVIIFISSMFLCWVYMVTRGRLSIVQFAHATLNLIAISSSTV